MKNFEIRRNEQANGIEIYFSCKPSESVRDALKGAGFRRQVRADPDRARRRDRISFSSPYFQNFPNFPEYSVC